MELSRRTVLGALAAGALPLALVWAFRARRRRFRHLVVRDVLIYPVKSCAEQRLPAASACAMGFKGDRVLQVSDEKEKRYCTPRQKDKRSLFHVQCELVGPRLSALTLSVKNGKAPPLHIDLEGPSSSCQIAVLGTPMSDGSVLQDFGDEAAKWLKSAVGIEGCRLTGIGSGYERFVAVNPKQGDPVPEAQAPLSLADEAPYLLATEASLADLNRRLVAKGERAVDMRRFRPNIVLKGCEAWEEDTWRKIRIGRVEFWVWQRDARCTMTTIDNDTLESSPEPLRTLSEFRERPVRSGVRNFGMHLVPVKGLPPDGVEIAEGDCVEVLELRGLWERCFT